MGKVIAISAKTSQDGPRESLESAELIAGYGIAGEVKGGKPGKNLCIISQESLEKISQDMASGENALCMERFSANIVLQGVALQNHFPGTVFNIGGTQCEIKQVGKPCFNCELQQKLGKPCNLATDVVFADVLIGGEITVGDVSDV